jgi:nucleoid-associated protein YgaU
MVMDLAASAIAFLKPGKAKLVRADAKADAGAGSALSSALSALPIPGLGAKDKDEELTFMFNPTEYKISQSVSISRAKGRWRPGGTVEYLGTSALTVSMQLFFDDFASAEGDVTPKISKLLDWQKPQPGKKPPPLVKFKWGNKQLDSFEGIITQLNINYTVFRKNGTPVQAKVDVTMEGVRKWKPGTNPTSHAVDMRKVHTIVEGESIHAVATAELGRPAFWRAIAEANGIDDPLRVKPGQALFVPSAADAARNV